ncbi:MAG: endonuclease/exonuclease/phosphatase family protein [Candidatus Hydrogenedentota bacterium]
MEVPEEYPSQSEHGLSHWRRWCRRIGCVLVGIAVFGLCVGQAGQHVWYLSALVHWAPAYLAFGIGGGACCFLGGGRRWALAGGICAAAALGLVLVYGAPARSQETAGMAPNLRILQANVWYDRGNPNDLIALVRETDPDLVLLQEADARWREALAPLEDDYPIHAIIPRYPKGDPALGMYSRIPTGPFKRLAEEGIPAVEFSIEVAARQVQLLNIHMASPWSPGRARRHKAQLKALARYLAEKAGNKASPLILTGDLNSSYYAPLYRMLIRKSGLNGSQMAWGLLGTWPSFLPPPLRIALDHTLVTPGIQIVNCRIGAGVGSDHKPLIVDLYVPE